MAVDKLVDSSKLDACCTAEANAIRAKTGDSSTLTYDWSNSKGFADAIGAIPSGGGGISLEDIVTNNFLSGAYVLDSNMTSYALDHKGNSDTPWTLKWTGSSASNRALAYTRGLTTLVITNFTYATNSFYNDSTELTTLDTSENRLPTNAWTADTSLNTVILRNTTVVTINNINSVSNNNPFKSGGSGGTIYIPKSLYDHLGDGSASDYKAATNWSTVNGYGTITWAKIEGSQYEHYYADGTAIPTS